MDLRILAIIGILVLVVSLLYSSRKHIEGLETIPIKYKKDTTTVEDGYYKIDENSMAIIPYGYVRDPNDQTKIIPNSQTTIEKNAPAEIKPPREGEILPDGYYLLDSNNLAILPPNMKPNLDRLTITGTPPELKYYYNPGYIGETAYYNLEFTLDKSLDVIPVGIYYTNEEKTKYALLKPDETIDTTKGWGKKRKENAANPDTTSWSRVKDNYDVEFHEPADVLLAREESDGQCATVVTPSGERLCIPRLDAQGQPLFYKPGSYKYGGINYIPKYEDSVYLSRTTQQPTVSAYEGEEKTRGFCEMKDAFPLLVEVECSKLDKHVCSSTSCCVLLGGQKCVGGDSSGPTLQAHYRDPALSVSDHYFHQGKCYGNCPTKL